jgi:hypothetical protein
MSSYLEQILAPFPNLTPQGYNSKIQTNLNDWLEYTDTIEKVRNFCKILTARNSININIKIEDIQLAIENELKESIPIGIIIAVMSHHFSSHLRKGKQFYFPIGNHALFYLETLSKAKS